MKHKEFLKEIRGLSVDELKERARLAREEAMKLSFRKASGQLEENFRITANRKDQARIQTVLSEKGAEQG